MQCCAPLPASRSVHRTSTAQLPLACSCDPDYTNTAKITKQVLNFPLNSDLLANEACVKVFWLQQPSWSNAETENVWLELPSIKTARGGEKKRHFAIEKVLPCQIAHMKKERVWKLCLSLWKIHSSIYWSSSRVSYFDFHSHCTLKELLTCQTQSKPLWSEKDNWLLFLPSTNKPKHSFSWLLLAFLLCTEGTEITEER